MQNGLVSIISPCYNKEKVVGRFIESVIQQTYRPIELIIIDDGSTDQSKKVIDSYESVLTQQGIQFLYIYQENAGLGAAINTGLRNATGEFLCWPDTDDWYEPTATEEKVRFLQTHLECAIVSSDAYVYYESKLDAPSHRQTQHDLDRENEKQFFLLLNGKSSPCPGLHMVRRKELMSVLKDGQIFPSRHGQDLQLLLPVYYHFNRGFLDQPLYNYVIYDNSMSHAKKTFEQTMRHREAMVELKEKVVTDIPSITPRDLQEALQTIHAFEARKRLKIAHAYKNKALAKEQFTILLNNSWQKKKDRLIYTRTLYPCLDRIYTGASRFIEKAYNLKSHFLK